MIGMSGSADGALFARIFEDRPVKVLDIVDEEQPQALSSAYVPFERSHVKGSQILALGSDSFICRCSTLSMFRSEFLIRAARI